MKNLALKTFILAFSIFIFTSQTNAQLCGRYSTTFSLNTTEGKPINNAVVRLIAIGEDETNAKNFVRDEKNHSEFSITFNEGHQIGGEYKVIFSAKGFKPFETEIRFPHCVRRNFILTLENSDSKTANNLEEIININFRAIDENKKAIAKVKTTVRWEKGKALETISNENGQTNFKVFNNKILKVSFNKDGYKTKEIEIDLREYKFQYMDVKLEKAEP